MQEPSSGPDLARVEFATSMRGYDKEEVDTFLRELAEEHNRLIGELASARRSAEKAHLELGEEIGELLQHAKDVADQLVKKAEEEAAATTEKARRDAERTTLDAQQRAEELRRASETDALKRLRDAQEKVAALQVTENQVRTRMYTLRQSVVSLAEQIEEVEDRPVIDQQVQDDADELETLRGSVPTAVDPAPPAE